MVTLQLKGVGARYGSTLAVEGVTTPVFSGGELTAVIGPNAAGKSTLFKRISGLLKGPGDVVLAGNRAAPRDAIRCAQPRLPTTRPKIGRPAGQCHRRSRERAKRPKEREFVCR